MSDSQPNVLAVLVIVLLGLAVAGALAVYGCTTLARHGVRRSGPAVLLRGCAALAGCAAAALYVWGAVHLIRDETMTDQACKDAVPSAQAASIDGYSVSYVPLQLDCHVKGAGTYAAAVPDYVNPGVVALALLAAVLGISAGFATELRARADFRKETSS
ncbi:hypothetical protein [Streptomyces sp. NPDC048825]|uniref:hypothetical protein n=1 Tax=Streptomyces sp. NPDC048825 TaxID=3365592 RepID=UPI003721B0AC